MFFYTMYNNYIFSFRIKIIIFYMAICILEEMVYDFSYVDFLILLMFYFQIHLENCVFSLTPCPNECANILLRGRLSEHLLNQCPKRMIKCSLCQLEFVAEKQQVNLIFVLYKFICYYLLCSNYKRGDLVLPLSIYPSVCLSIHPSVR